MGSNGKPNVDKVVTKSSSQDQPVASSIMDDLDAAGLKKHGQVADPEGQFSELFQAASGAVVAVRLFRLTPVVYAGEDIKGFLEDLPPGLGSYMEYIKQRHGGGLYRICKTVDSQIKDNKSLNIPACPPRFPDKIVDDAKPATLSGVTVDGFPLDGSDADFERMVLRMAMMKKALQALDGHSTPDINTVLLEHFLAEKVQPSIVDQVSQISSVIASVREFVPSGGDGGGGDWMTVIAKGIDAFKEAVSAGALSPPIPTAPASDRPGVGGGAAQVAGLIPSKTKENPTMDQLAGMTLRDKAMIAVEILLSNALLKPPQDKQAVVQSIDFALNLSAEDRARISAFSGALRSMVVAEAAPSFSAGEADRAEFEAYLDSVMDLFFDPTREGATLA